MGKKPKKNSCKGKCQEKNSCKEEGKEKKFMQKEGPIVIFISYIKSANKHVKMELTDLRDSHSVVLIKAFSVFLLQACL